jgi:hypothetical protein
MSLFGKVFGDSKDADPGEGANKLAWIAEQQLQQAQPIKNALIDRSKAFLGGGGDLYGTPSFQALKSASDTQFKTARNNVMSSLPQGGALLESLANLEGQKASNLTQGYGNLYENELSRAFALGTGGTPVAMNALGQAAGVSGQLAQAQSQQNQAMNQSLGYAAGSYLGSAYGAGGSKAAGSAAAGTGASSGAAAACWVAEVLYGPNSFETKTIRAYVLEHMQDKSIFGYFCRLYSKYGKSWAEKTKRIKTFRFIAKLIWDKLYRRAIHA